MRPTFVIGAFSFSGGSIGAINLLKGAEASLLLSWPVVGLCLMIGVVLIAWMAVA